MSVNSDITNPHQQITNPISVNSEITETHHSPIPCIGRQNSLTPPPRSGTTSTSRRGNPTKLLWRDERGWGLGALVTGVDARERDAGAMGDGGGGGRGEIGGVGGDRGEGEGRGGGGVR